MYRLLAALLLVAGITAFGYEPPKPRAPAMRVSVTALAGVLRVKWTIAAASGVDSTTVDVTGPSPAPVHRKYLALNKTDSLDFARPLAGDSIGGSVTATSWRRLLSASAIPVQWGYREPDVPPPPPGVTVQIVPASFSASPGQKLHFTVTVS